MIDPFLSGSIGDFDRCVKGFGRRAGSILVFKSLFFYIWRLNNSRGFSIPTLRARSDGRRFMNNRVASVF